MHGGGVCMAGGMCGRGCAWQVDMYAMHAPPQQILRDTVNERAVHILLEGILVDVMCKQQNSTAMNPLLNGTKMVTLKVHVMAQKDYIAQCRSFHTTQSHIQIPILTANYRNGIGISRNVNEP